MADIDCNKEVGRFHGAEVTLSRDDQKEMRERRDAGRTRLRLALDRAFQPRPNEQASQGSYAMRTMVQDDECDYDIDDGAYFRKEDLVDAKGVALTPRQARERVCKALCDDQRLKHNAVVLTNCVRQVYPQGYHIDIPVYRIVVTTDKDGCEITHFELSSGDEWKRSDARSVTRWFNDLVGELNAGESDGSQMRRVTKLSKKLSRSRPKWKAKAPSGICVTKLVVDHFVPCEGRDDKSLRQTWQAMKAALDKSTAINHPVLPGVKLAHAVDAEFVFFRDCLVDSLAILSALDKIGCTRQLAREAWDDVFDTTFFTEQPDQEANPKKAAAVIQTSSGAARRDDGGGRFG